MEKVATTSSLTRLLGRAAAAAKLTRIKWPVTVMAMLVLESVLTSA
jgi:hypothetical protein